MPGKVVLVIDDDVQVATVVRDALEDEGYSVVIASDERSAFEALRIQPCVILLDLTLPWTDGATMCVRLRADPAGANARIVLMSARMGLDTLRQDLPVDDILAKPFNLDDLYAVVALRGPS